MEPHFDEEIEVVEAGPLELAIGIAAEVGPSELEAGPLEPTTRPAPTALEALARTPTTQPNDRFDDQIRAMIASLVANSVKTELQILSTRVDGLQIELHDLRTETHDSLALLRGRLESVLADILIAIQQLTPALALAGSLGPPSDSPPLPPLAAYPPAAH